MNTINLDINPQTATTVMLVSGLSEAYEKGKTISGFENVKDALVFHAGAKYGNDEVVTSGGRVMAVTAFN